MDTKNLMQNKDGFAVMDLGTNTFHLLIVKDGHEIVREQEAVKLGEGGINKGFIAPEAFARGIKTMQQFSGLISQHQISQVKAIATSALRNASNGTDFINEVKQKTGISIDTIDGETEAAYIYEGVKASGCLSAQNSLVMDVGGGSVEFIICSNQKIYWKQSFETGAARLMDQFHRTDPIPPESITALSLYLNDCFEPLFEAIKKYPVDNLVGSSGVFESYAGLIEAEHGRKFNLAETKRYNFDLEELLALLEQLVLSSHQQRIENNEITAVRKDMIVTASLLIRFVINTADIKDVVMTTYSLKEGVIAEMVG